MITASLLILGALFALAAWHSPIMLRYLTAHLAARFEEIEAAQAAHADALRRWKGTFGVGETRTLALKRRLEWDR